MPITDVMKIGATALELFACVQTGIAGDDLEGRMTDNLYPLRPTSRLLASVTLVLTTVSNKNVLLWTRFQCHKIHTKFHENLLIPS
jgi:hypothetical protein